MTTTPCPDPQRLSRLDDEELPLPQKRELSAHVADCPSCRRAFARFKEFGRTLREDRSVEESPDTLLAQWEEAAREDPNPGYTDRMLRRVASLREKRKTGSSRPAVSFLRWGIAASFLFAAALGSFFMVGFSDPYRSAQEEREGIAWCERGGERIPAGEDFRFQSGDRIRTGGGEWTHVFPKGARLTLSPDTDLAYTGREDRLNLVLSRGGAELHVPPGAQAFRVKTPSGTFTDEGTRFRLRVLPPLTLGETHFPRLTVCEVREGEVHAKNEAGFLPVAAGHQTFLWEGIPPEGQIVLSAARTRTDEDRSLPVFLEMLERGETAPLLPLVEQWILAGQSVFPRFQSFLDDPNGNERHKKIVRTLQHWLMSFVPLSLWERG